VPDAIGKHGQAGGQPWPGPADCLSDCATQRV
jgi:hypothetical protein